MQFLVPQFIEVESKIIGPISVRQFIILLVAAVFIFLSWEMFTFWIAAVLAVFWLAAGGCFAFVKVNSQPFHIFALCLLQTFKCPRLRFWTRESKIITVTKKPKKDAAKKTKEEIIVPKQFSNSRLAELSLMVDTGGVYSPEELQTKIQIPVKKK